MDHEYWSRRDRNVAFAAPGRIGVAVLVASFLLARPLVAHACSLVAPGIVSRTVWPSAEQGIPVNARIVVEYGLGSALQGFDIPPLGPDVTLFDGHTPVVTSFELVGSRVVVTPAAPLMPNYTYAIADRRNLCDAISSGCALGDVPKIFATFTTGSGADATPPTFDGLTAQAVGQRMVCNDGACCGPYDVVPIDLSWTAGSDDVAGSDLRYNLYALPAGGVQAKVLLAGLIDSTTLRGYQTCGNSSLGGTEIKPGRYMIRAVDWAGNEDGNAHPQMVGGLCPSHPLACAVGGPVASGATNLGVLLLFAAAVAIAAAARLRPRRGHGPNGSHRTRGGR